eukprot:scaffold75966_cov74-Phaeocystis_antarctica.AAC.5
MQGRRPCLARHCRPTWQTRRLAGAVAAQPPSAPMHCSGASGVATSRHSSGCGKARARRHERRAQRLRQVVDVEQAELARVEREGQAGQAVDQSHVAKPLRLGTQLGDRRKGGQQ